MFLVNNEQLRLADDNEIARETRKLMAEVDKKLKANGGHVVFRYPPEKSKPNKDVEILEGGRSEKQTMAAIPLATVVIHPDRGRETWKYQPAPGMTGSGSYLDFEGYMPLGVEDKELILFLMYKSKMVGKGKTIEIEDKSADAAIIAEKQKYAAQIIQHIYGDSPMNTDENLRAMAKALYLSNVDAISDLNIVRNMIEQTVNASEVQRQYFLQLIDSKKQIEIKSTIQQAIDEGVIAFDNARIRWIYGEGSHVIVELMPPQVEEKNLHLENYLMANEKDYNYIRKSLSTYKAKVEQKNEEAKKTEEEVAELYQRLGVDPESSGQVKRHALVAEAGRLDIDKSGTVSELEERIINT